MKNTTIIRRHRDSISLVLCFLALSISACNFEKEKAVYQPRIPYPDAKTAESLQAKVDSSKFVWFRDVKATASAFCNEELRLEKGLSTADIVILSEAVFHAQVEVRLPQKVVVLTLERPFKHRGKDSIWQVIKMEEKSGG